MLFWQREVRPGWWVAFTDVQAGTMSRSVPVDSEAEQNRIALGSAVQVNSGFQFMNQVHGTTVHRIERRGPQPEADGMVSATVPLAVLVADCLPVLLLGETPDGTGLAAAVHAGRRGVEANILASAVQQMRSVGAAGIEAWIGPAICGRCYEVPEAMRSEVSALVPETFAETSWGTPALDLRAGAAAQLRGVGSEVNHVDYCTLAEPALFSHRGGAPIGRFAGLIYRTEAGKQPARMSEADE